MIAKLYSAIPYGFSGQLITVEGDMNRGLPSFNIVGMANKTISEARGRVKSALANSDLIFPTRRVTVNLAPAEFTKDGSHLDVPIALAVLTLSQQLLAEDVNHRLFVGELSLDGQIKPVRGIINIIETARKHRFKEIYVPFGNLTQASTISGIKIYGVHTLLELLLHLKGVQPLLPLDASHSTSIIVKNTKTDTNRRPSLHPPIYLDQIKDQTFAKRALQIALAGHHNILFCGPPGTGKTLLARAAAHLLPDPTPEESLTITKIHSLHSSISSIISTRPFRSPHHSSSSTSIIGGGPHVGPGEISLAHGGILFLDELPEFPRNVLEALREPLESHEITVTRSTERVTYPANFMLIATMNPCPCGYLSDPQHECTCTPLDINRYRKKISGPILDRIDLIVNVEPVKTSALLSELKSVRVKNTETDTIAPEHIHVKNTITDCHLRQHTRYHCPEKYNSSLSSSETESYVHLTPESKNLLRHAIDTLHLSARSYYKILKVALTIADLERSTSVRTEHISEALAFRQRLFDP